MFGLIAYLSAKQDPPGPWVQRLNEWQRRHPTIWLIGIWSVIALVSVLMNRVHWLAVVFGIMGTVRTLRDKSHSDAT